MNVDAVCARILTSSDPRTTRRYECSRHHLDRSPNYLLATALTQS